MLAWDPEMGEVAEEDPVSRGGFRGPFQRFVNVEAVEIFVPVIDFTGGVSGAPEDAAAKFGHPEGDVVGGGGVIAVIDAGDAEFTSGCRGWG